MATCTSAGPVRRHAARRRRVRPGGARLSGVYDLYDDGEARQEVRHTSSARALAHSTRCRDFVGGRYRDLAPGSIADRSWVVSP
jgi:hypothetical protein